MSDMLLSASELAARLAHRAEAVCRHYLPGGRLRGNYWICGDVQGTKGRSLHVHLAGQRAGRFSDMATGEYGDLLDLIMLNRDCGFGEACAEARAFLGQPLPPLQRTGAAKAGSAGNHLRRAEAARQLFAASQPIQGTLGEAWLLKRGISISSLPAADVAALRFNPRCYYLTPAGRGKWPAMVAGVTDCAGRITGVHRTFLARDGLDTHGVTRAPVDNPRRALGNLSGYGVRFGSAGDTLLVAEGIETALSLKTALPNIPVVASLSAVFLSTFILPEGLRRLYIAMDDDDAGRIASERLQTRAHGIDVRVLAPKGDDFNTDLLDPGAGGLRNRLSGQLAADDRRFPATGPSSSRER